MKLVFNFFLGLALGGALVAATAGPVSAETTYFTTRSVLVEFFPTSEKVTYVRFSPSAADKRALEDRLGYALARTSYVFYVATTGTRVDGYAFIDDQMGQHQPITFAVQLGPDRRVVRQEIMVYREQRGDEVRDARFRRQFVGKTARDPIRANDDIDCISGATISSHAMATGVKRAVTLFEIAVPREPTRVSRSGSD